MTHKKIIECDNCRKEIHGEYYTHEEKDYCSIECMAKDQLEYGVKNVK